MLILALDAALARCSAALWRDGEVLAERMAAAGRGHAKLLAPMAQQVLSGVPDAVAVTIGPGSFTGLRAAIALAQGLAAGAGVAVLGVTVAEALREQVGPLRGRAPWVAIDNRRGRIFLDRDGDLAPVALDGLPVPGGPVVVAGDAAIAVAAWLAARGGDVRLSDARLPRARDVAAAAARQLAGEAPMREAQPLYVDPPEARLPAGGLRPAPR
ncbi:MAG TPA: tRNA (adenosine(37)-N6)-threonylcarbamoyltransferase complex dimerization subunit type 1 TsaB [Acetobacteraceae bacterium]|nr:tRNA (adenosine(37)-N6)-threonylcarbamoyltransferase complex dimerization subunit type 1 TsaB [Acetobacteraceae bacterium]